MDLLTILEFFALFTLVNMEHPNHKYHFEKRLKFDGLKKEINRKRYLDLVRYTQNVLENDEKVINPDDIIGTIPSNFFENFNLNFTNETVNNFDNMDTFLSESQINIEQVNPEVTMGESVENEQILPYEGFNSFFPPQKRVKVHVFRGPNMRYWIQRKDGKKEKKFYSNWGYIIKQPVDKPDISFDF